MTYAESIEVVTELVELIGRGFHPDSAIVEYHHRLPDGTLGARMFEDDEASIWQGKLDAAFARLGMEIYDIAHDAMQD
jgi:hypothetical protein